MGKASSWKLTGRNINKETLCKHETNFGSHGYPVNPPWQPPFKPQRSELSQKRAIHRPPAPPQATLSPKTVLQAWALLQPPITLQMA